MFEIPKIVKKIQLAEYAPEFEEQSLNVWVNPPTSVIERWDAAVVRVKEDPLHAVEGLAEIDAVLAELWMVTVEDVRELRNGSESTDPGLITWLMRQTWSLVFEHRMQRKKA